MLAWTLLAVPEAITLRRPREAPILHAKSLAANGTSFLSACDSARRKHSKQIWAFIPLEASTQFPLQVNDCRPVAF